MEQAEEGLLARRALRRFALPLLAALIVAPRAWADYECVGGYRDTTPAERAAMRSALQAAVDAMPPAPEGWVLEGDDRISVIEGMCRDFEEGPWTYGQGRSYQRIDDREERDRILKEAANTMMADIAAKQSRADAIMARIMELSQQAMEAQQQSDYELVDEINRDIEAASNEYQALMEEGDADDRMLAAQVEAGRDLTMSIDIHFNYMRNAPGYEARPWTVGGVPGTAFRWSDTRDTVSEDHALILIGDWRETGDGSFEISPDAKRGAAAAQSISVHVVADAGRIEQVVSEIDFDALGPVLAGR